jgi:hypothetical protein
LLVIRGHASLFICAYWFGEEKVVVFGFYP